MPPSEPPNKKGLRPIADADLDGREPDVDGSEALGAQLRQAVGSRLEGRHVGLGAGQQTLEVELLGRQLGLIEALFAGTGVQFLLSYNGHLQPEESVHDITGD